MARDYDKEYKDFHGTEEQKKNRALRNKANRKAKREGKIKKGDGNEVDHKVPLSKGGSGSDSNTRVVSKKVNRKKAAK